MTTAERRGLLVDWGGVLTTDLFASFAAFVYLTLVGSLLAFTTFGWLLRKAPLPLVSTYAYVNPVVAVILGAVILGETIDLRTVVAGAVILMAVALIVTARGRMPQPRSAVRPPISERGDVPGASPQTSTSTVSPDPAPTG